MLWYDCITADSIVYSDHQFSTYSNGSVVHYRMESDHLFRTQLGTEQDLKLEVLDMEKVAVEEGAEIVITFGWKGAPLEWRFFDRPDVADEVNQFFDRRDG